MSLHDDKDCHWSQAQKDAFEQIEKIMREHFEAGVFYMEAEINDKQTESRGSYHGGRNIAVGMHARCLHNALHAGEDELQP